MKAVWWWCLSLVQVVRSASAYNRPECDAWPSHDVWEQELGALLSSEASLTALDEDTAITGESTSSSYFYEDRCFPLGKDPYQLANSSICMQDPKCAYTFCNSYVKEANWPAYILKAKTEQDVAKGMLFADKHNVQVTVKTTGHSFQGSSTAKDSLLIWMYHFEKDGIIRNVTDSCGVTATIVGVGGGEIWDDVLEAVKDDYHVITGYSRTVSAAGGWLQGHGLSFTSRRYGLGIDQVVRMQVVLPNGTLAVTDACTNPDLFWALRGGGGGTYGVVTHVDYKVHPLTPLTIMKFKFNVAHVDSLGRFDVVLLWLRYWVSVSPSLDERWSGSFNGGAVHLVFAGTQQEALDSFGESFRQWYWGVLQVNATATEGLIVDPLEIYQVPSWYKYRGGADAYRNNPKKVKNGGDNYNEQAMGARLVPLDMVLTAPEKVVQMVAELARSGTLQATNYFLGGNINSVADEATAVHPAMRNAIYHIVIRADGQKVHNTLRSYLPNDITGVSFNHHYVLEPDWKNACWGSNYARLLEIKDIIDPRRRLNCWHCVGYQGPDPEDPSYTQPACPS